MSKHPCLKETLTLLCSFFLPQYLPHYFNSAFRCLHHPLNILLPRTLPYPVLLCTPVFPCRTHADSEAAKDR